MIEADDGSQRGRGAGMASRLSLKVLGLVCLVGGALLTGCGKAPPTEAPDSLATEEETEQQPAEETAPRVETVEVDFASLGEFPQLAHAASGNLEGGDVRYPLMEGETVRGASGEVLETFWEGIAPATFEVTLPPEEVNARVREVRVTSLGGDRAFQECVVYIQPKGLEGEWRRPDNLHFEKVTLENTPGGPAHEHIFRFQPVRAGAVRIGFAVGCTAHPDRVFVEDIDILGTSEREVE